jgi:hypothetical protein
MATKKVSCKSKKISKSSNKKKTMKRGGGSRRRTMRGGMWPFSTPTPEQSVRKVMQRIKPEEINRIPVVPTSFITKPGMSSSMMSLPPPKKNAYSAVTPNRNPSKTTVGTSFGKMRSKMSTGYSRPKGY